MHSLFNALNRMYCVKTANKVIIKLSNLFCRTITLLSAFTVTIPTKIHYQSDPQNRADICHSPGGQHKAISNVIITSLEQRILLKTQTRRFGYNHGILIDTCQPSHWSSLRGSDKTLVSVSKLSRLDQNQQCSLCVWNPHHCLSLWESLSSESEEGLILTSVLSYQLSGKDSLWLGRLPHIWDIRDPLLLQKQCMRQVILHFFIPTFKKALRCV